MSRVRHFLLAALLLPLFCPQLRGQEFLLGLYSSPKGVGVSCMFESRSGKELDLITARTDFYGLLTGRTRDVGVCLSYTHDYVFYQRERRDYRLQLHAGAGGMLGYAHDFEKGFFSTYDRQLVRNPGGVAALVGNIGLRADLWEGITLDVSLSAAPGLHLRTDTETGALLLSFYSNGVVHFFYPQINLMYRF